MVAGRYRLGEVLGRGGMGVVWLAEDELLRRPVAVKEVLFPAGLTPGERAVVRERTLREARAAGRLNHPSVVTVYDVVEDDGRPFIVMEPVQARTLADIIRTAGPLPPRRAAEIGLAVLGALRAAHAVGIVHRDVKPSNVLLPDDGRVVLTDFGIAHASGDVTLTSTGAVLGSPAYIAPERARGGQPQPASDLFSLGATLFAAVEGRPPFDKGDLFATLTSVVVDDPAPMRTTGPLAELIGQLLVKDPASRPSADRTRELLGQAARSATEPTSRPVASVPGPAPAVPVAAEQTQVISREAMRSARQAAPKPVPASAPRLRPPPPRPARPAAATRPVRKDRSRGLWLSAAAAGVALVLGGAGWYAVDRQLGANEPTPPAAQQSTASSPSPEQVGSPSTPPSPSAEPDPTVSPQPTDGTSTPSPEATTPTAQSPAEPAAGVPADWRTYTADAGWSIRYPPDWTVEQTNHEEAGLLTDFRDGAGRLLRVDIDEYPRGTALADWQEYEPEFAAGRDGYERIRMENVDYRDYDTADWEFRYLSQNGNLLHALDRGMIIPGADESAYALFFLTREEQWESSQDLFRAFAASFQPG